eukprot:g10021.t1
MPIRSPVTSRRHKKPRDRTSAGSFAVAFAALAHPALFPRTVFAAPEADRIASLPGYGPPPTAQYSGFLDATDGCDTEKNGKYCRLHYWFATSENNVARHKPAEKIPVVLWLNGGPGSSSLIGFLEENGPLLVNSTGGLMPNPYAWTKEVHLLAIEQPVGVGFSYCAVQKESGGKKICANSDKMSASANRAALVDFFANKFPELAGNPFFITGESYAGVYIPTLAKEIIDHAGGKVPLVGLAVGDPCTDNVAQKDSMDALWYY